MVKNLSKSVWVEARELKFCMNIHTQIWILLKFSLEFY
jgi:hypothetical protein